MDDTKTKFWAQYSDDDDDFEGDIYDSGLESEEDEFEKADSEGDFSDEEEESKKVIRSAKDKKFEELRVCVKNINNKMIIDDWVAVASGMYSK